MTQTEINELLEVLDYQESVTLLDTDKERLTKLANSVKLIKPTMEDEFISLTVDKLTRKCCEILNYEPSVQNNKSRHPDMVERRRAIAYLVYLANGKRPRCYSDIGRVIGKTRASVMFLVESAEMMEGSQDREFMFAFNKLIKSRELRVGK